MYKVGKVFMEDVKIYTDNAEHRIVQCPICGEEMFLEDDDVSGRKDNVTGQKHRFELMEE